MLGCWPDDTHCFLFVLVFACFMARLGYAVCMISIATNAPSHVFLLLIPVLAPCTQVLLRQEWARRKLPVASRLSFLSQVVGAAPYSTTVHALFRRKLAELTAQSPIARRNARSTPLTRSAQPSSTSSVVSAGSSTMFSVARAMKSVPSVFGGDNGSVVGSVVSGKAPYGGRSSSPASLAGSRRGGASVATSAANDAYSAFRGSPSASRRPSLSSQKSGGATSVATRATSAGRRNGSGGDGASVVSGYAASVATARSRASQQQRSAGSRMRSVSPAGSYAGSSIGRARTPTSTTMTYL